MPLITRTGPHEINTCNGSKQSISKYFIDNSFHSNILYVAYMLYRLETGYCFGFSKAGRTLMVPWMNLDAGPP